MKGSEHTRKVINHIQLFLTSSNNFLLFLLGVGGAVGGEGAGWKEGMVEVVVSTVSLV